MQEELRENPNAYFMTLTIDDKSYKELKKKSDDKTDNGIATKAIRLMLERIRKKTGKSIKHWFVTELGHEIFEDTILKRYKVKRTERRLIIEKVCEDIAKYIEDIKTILLTNNIEYNYLKGIHYINKFI